MITAELVNSRKSFPERNLLVAMLERALLDYFGNQSLEKQEAEDWLFDEADADDEFSFAWICAHLELDKDQVLARLSLLNPEGEMSPGHWWGIRRHA